MHFNGVVDPMNRDDVTEPPDVIEDGVGGHGVSLSTLCQLRENP
jgi:hypothetical protein